MIAMIELECVNPKCDAVIQDNKDTKSGLVAGGMSINIVFFDSEKDDEYTCDTCEQVLELDEELVSRFKRGK